MLGGLQWRAAPRRGSSAAAGRQHVHLGNARQALRGLPIVCPGCHRCAEPGEAALRWPCIGGGMAAAGQRGQGAFRGACSHLRCWRVERAVARARGSTSCGGNQELHAADLWIWGKKPTNTHLRPGMDSNEASCKRHGDSAGGRVDDWGCRVRSSRAIDAPCENLSSLLPALRHTRLDCRAVQRFLVAASSSAALRCTRLDCRAVRKSYVAAPIWISCLLPKKNGRQMMLRVRAHERCCQAACLVKAFAARYRLHRADPALWCVVIFDRPVAVDCAHVSVISLWF